MLELQRFEKRIAQEEKLAREAISAELAQAHRQVAMLYKTELAIIRRKRVATVGEMLADLG